MKLIIGMLAALCGFSVSANTLTCYNPSENTQICTSTNGYTVTCNKVGDFITCTGSDGKVTTMYQP